MSKIKEDNDADKSVVTSSSSEDSSEDESNLDPEEVLDVHPESKVLLSGENSVAAASGLRPGDEELFSPAGANPFGSLPAVDPRNGTDAKPVVRNGLDANDVEAKSNADKEARKKKRAKKKKSDKVAREKDEKRRRERSDRNQFRERRLPPRPRIIQLADRDDRSNRRPLRNAALMVKNMVRGYVAPEIDLIHGKAIITFIKCVEGKMGVSEDEVGGMLLEIRKNYILEPFADATSELALIATLDVITLACFQETETDFEEAMTDVFRRLKILTSIRHRIEVSQAQPVASSMVLPEARPILYPEYPLLQTIFPMRRICIMVLRFVRGRDRGAGNIMFEPDRLEQCLLAALHRVWENENDIKAEIPDRIAVVEKMIRKSLKPKPQDPFLDHKSPVVYDAQVRSTFRELVRSRRTISTLENCINSHLDDVITCNEEQCWACNQLSNFGAKQLQKGESLARECLSGLELVTSHLKFRDRPATAQQFESGPENNQSKTSRSISRSRSRRSRSRESRRRLRSRSRSH